MQKSWSYEELNGSGSATDNRTFKLTTSSNYYSGTVLEWRQVP